VRVHGLVVCIAIAACSRQNRAEPQPSETTEPVPSVTPEPVPPVTPEPHWVPSAEVPMDPSGGLSGKDLKHPVYWYRKSARTCLPATCTGRIAVEIEVRIGADGSVASTKTVKGDPKIGACLEKLVSKGPFSKSDAGGTFQIPFLFEC
jgi:hypothetical protein